MDLLERARETGTPLIDGETATFVWQGDDAPFLAGDFSGWGRKPPVRFEQAGDRLWAAQITLPRDTYAEYALFTGPTDQDRVRDPFNRRRVWNGISAYNQWFAMPDRAMTRLTRRGAGVPAGKLTHLTLDTGRFTAVKNREYMLYAPPNVGEPVPLVLVYDGTDYLRRAHLTTIVDNLIAQRRIRPVALAMIANGRKTRFLEYAMSDLPLMFFFDAMLPLARQHLNLIDPAQQPGAWGVIGASMGGLMALYTGIRAPQIFGHVIAQSAALEFSVAGRPMPIFDLYAHGERPALRIWQDVGTLEWLLDSNRSMHELLARRGYDVTYTEAHSGHNYTAWANLLVGALEHQFPVS